MTTESEKIACIDQQVEMSLASKEFMISRFLYSLADAEYGIDLKLVDQNGNKLEIKVQSADLIDATTEAYRRFKTFTSALPTFRSDNLLELRRA